MIARIVSTFLALAFVVLTLLFASLLVAVALSAGLLAGAWLWWRGRRAPRNRVIEGEYRIIDTR